MKFLSISCVNTNSAAEFGNKVQSCGTEDAKVFYCYNNNIIIIYSHQEMHIKSRNISMASADNKGQLRTPSLTNNNSSKNNTEALCCVEICELT